MKDILNVGHCNADGPQMKSLFEKDIHSVTVTEAKTHEAALEALKEKDWDLVLVNRIFDYDAYSGLEFITEILNTYPDQKVLLVSNLRDAQEDAKNRGALKGFGKDDLNSSEVVEYIKTLLA